MLWGRAELRDNESKTFCLCEQVKVALEDDRMRNTS